MHFNSTASFNTFSHSAPIGYWFWQVLLTVCNVYTWQMNVSFFDGWPTTVCPCVGHMWFSLMSLSLLLQQHPRFFFFFFFFFPFSVSVGHVQVFARFSGCGNFIHKAPAYFACLTRMVCGIGSKWPFSCSFKGYFFQELFKTAHNILV